VGLCIPICASGLNRCKNREAAPSQKIDDIDIAMSVIYKKESKLNPPIGVNPDGNRHLEA
jgi:hypothetical protein